MAAPSDCPESDRWQALFDDALPADEREQYEHHLEACSACQARLDRADECEDVWRRLGQQAGDPTVAPADRTLIRVLQQIHTFQCPDRPPPPEPIDLYFLAPTDRPDLLGTLGPYEVQDVIGQGGMGVVLKAFDPALQRLVAIKVLAPALAGSAAARRRFTRETQAAAAVAHDHVVAVHGVCAEAGLPYLVMQYVAGESLQERLDRDGPLKVVDIVRIGLQTAAGLAAAHAQGLIHRDIKPSNILLENGLARVKITDFGLARTANDVGVTASGVVAGTPEYMAPEQARGEPIDHRADLFALGSVLYAMCTGTPPFRAATTLAVLRQVSDEAPRPVRTVNPDVPAWLAAVIARLLEKSPDDRFQSAMEVASLLERYLAYLIQPTTLAPPELPAPSRTGSTKRPAGTGTKRSRWPVRLVVLLLLVPLGLWVAMQLAGDANGPASGKELQEVYHPSLGGGPDIPPGLELFGPGAREVVRFDSNGLRISMPAGYPERRQRIGVSTNFSVRGDCEVTARFAILQAPDPSEAGLWGSGLTLGVVLERPENDIASLTWNVQADEGTKFASFLWKAAPDKPFQRRRVFPAQARSGQLRITRKGSVLYCYAAEGASEEFRLLDQVPFSTEDLRRVALTCATGGPRAAIEACVTDLRIRAASSPGVTSPDQPQAGNRTSLVAAVAVLAAIACAGLAAWLMSRGRRARGAKPEQAPGEGQRAGPDSLPAFQWIVCTHCAKKLKARAELAGRKVKCPQCGTALSIPGPESDDAAGASA